MNNDKWPRLTRRGFLAGTIAAALAACSSSESGSDTSSGPSATTDTTAADATTSTFLADPTTSAASIAQSDPFTLGIASGDPLPDSVILWTRLLPAEPLDDTDIEVTWEIALDEDFADVVGGGTALAVAALGHSVHVEASGLDPDQDYYYRFGLGEYTTPPARTHTFAAPGMLPDRFRFAFSSCQNWEQGRYAAYRDLVEEGDIDAFVFLGDYIYEYASGGYADPRGRTTGQDFECESIEQYRERYALYHSDPLLQAAHALVPWIITWDDHEVENDYANDRSQNDEAPASFLARRAAAYQAYYEHMPLPSSMAPAGPSMRIYTRLALGQLAEIFLLDDRQYRTDQPCPASGEGGARLIENCQERLDPHATLLGVEQERWLSTSLESSTARWKLLAQQTLMAQADSLAGPGQRFYSDGWDGYPAARKRLLGHIASRRIRNPVVLSGDVHSFWANDLAVDFDDAQSPTIASEFVTTSITSRPPPEERIQTAKGENPRIRFATGTRRGYLRLELTPARLRADLRAVDDATDPSSGCSTLASFVVEDGRPGLHRD